MSLVRRIVWECSTCVRLLRINANSLVDWASSVVVDRRHHNMASSGIETDAAECNNDVQKCLRNEDDEICAKSRKISTVVQLTVYCLLLMISG